MSILTEIADAVESKLKKYSNNGLSADMMNKLTDMLISEAVVETAFSEGITGGVFD
jgi:hypothetical protein